MLTPETYGLVIPWETDNPPTRPRNSAPTFPRMHLSSTLKPTSPRFAPSYA